jgi:hypothetical protein
MPIDSNKPTRHNSSLNLMKTGKPKWRGGFTKTDFFSPHDQTLEKMKEMMTLLSEAAYKGFKEKKSLLQCSLMLKVHSTQYGMMV